MNIILDIFYVICDSNFLEDWEPGWFSSRHSINRFLEQLWYTPVGGSNPIPNPVQSCIRSVFWKWSKKKEKKKEKKIKSKSTALKILKSNPNPVECGKLAKSRCKSKSGFGVGPHWIIYTAKKRTWTISLNLLWNE